ncbi:MAG: alkaline phosphatase family protein, partial [Gammaproteobacteria bacterium]|nr:alkaline phosphatase family protein [Gammaproteobacteria bacterium]
MTMPKSRCFLLLLLLICSACQSTPPAGSVTRIAFGSCNRSDLPQPLWSPILESEPQLWIWTGDNVYGDTLDMSVLATKYREQSANPGYQQLQARV